MSTLERNNLGIDIIGFPRGKLGIGDQVRSLVKMSIINGYEVNLIDCIHPTDNIINDHMEYNHLISNTFKYPIRIYSLTQNHIAALIYRFGVNFFDCKNNIFQLAWEFDERPTQLDTALKFADEIWGISSFTSKAFENNYGIPVETMHNAVELPALYDCTRDNFNLPVDLYLFCFSFDFNSWTTRKNPGAVIEAFKLSGLNKKGAGLVIKVSNVNTFSEEWINFLHDIKYIDNIYVINKTMDKPDVISLFRCCDCYVSLHRSEGFGMGMAENMLLGKPVICTGFSGNMDFCNDDNAYIVDYSIVVSSESDYTFSEGFKWADPDIKSSASKMINVFDNQSKAKEKGQKAMNYINKKFTPAALAPHFDDLIQNFLERKKLI